MAVYLIDFENVRSEGLKGSEALTEKDSVVIFYSNNADSLTFEAHQVLLKSKAQIDIYKINKGGKNALDFQLSTYLGYLIQENMAEDFYIVSKDTGFSYVCDFWSQQKEIQCQVKTISSIQEVPVQAEKQEPAKEESAKEVKVIKEPVQETKVKPQLVRVKNQAAASRKRMKPAKTNRVVPIITKTSRMNNEVQNLVKGKCKETQMQQLIEHLKAARDKQHFYNLLVHSFGQDEGLKIYKGVKSQYLKLKQICV